MYMYVFFFQAEDGIRDSSVTGVQTCALPILNRRHRGKSEAWKTKKYFTTIQGDNWVFFGTTEEHTCYLLRATSVPIVRHVKIQGEANPYDLAWESYFEKRLDFQMPPTLHGTHSLL